jgi:hypothetical protein
MSGEVLAPGAKGRKSGDTLARGAKQQLPFEHHDQVSSLGFRVERLGVSVSL